MAITKEQALAELARRELARRESLGTSKSSPVTQQNIEAKKVGLGERIMGRVLGFDPQQEMQDLATNNPDAYRGLIAAQNIQRTGSQLGQSAMLGGAVGSGLRQVPFLAGQASKIPVYKNAIIAAAEGAAGSQAFDGNANERIRNAAIGGVLGAAIPPVAKGISSTIKESGNVIKAIPSVISKSQRVATVSKFEEQLANKRWGTLTKWFGKQLDNFVEKNPTKTIGIRDELVDASVRASEDPQLASAIKHPKIQALLSDLDVAKNLTLREAQEIKNILTGKLTEKVKSGIEYTAKSRGVRDLINNINNKIVSLDEGMQKVYDTYATKAEQYKMFSPSFRGKRAVENVLNGPTLFQRLSGNRSYLGGEASQEAFEKFSPRIARQVGYAKSASQLLENSKRIGMLAAADLARRKLGIKIPLLET